MIETFQSRCASYEGLFSAEAAKAAVRWTQHIGRSFYFKKIIGAYRHNTLIFFGWLFFLLRLLPFFAAAAAAAAVGTQW